MIAIIHDYEKEFGTTPRAGWLSERFYLISNGGHAKRVYSPRCEDIPAFAWGRPGAPKRKKKAVDAVIDLYDNRPTGWEKNLVAEVEKLSAEEFDKLPIKVIGAYNQYK